MRVGDSERGGGSYGFVLLGFWGFLAGSCCPLAGG